MWEAWTNTDSTFLRFTHVFSAGSCILNKFAVRSPLVPFTDTIDWLSIGIVLDTQLILDWHLGQELTFSINAYESVNTLLTIDQCWSSVSQVSLNFYSFVYVLFDCHMMYIVNSISSLDELFLLLQQMLLKKKVSIECWPKVDWDVDCLLMDILIGGQSRASTDTWPQFLQYTWLFLHTVV